MSFLLFILGSSFFYIFFVFSQNLDLKESFFSNVFYEANIYIILSVLFIYFAYSRQSFKKNSSDSQGNSSLSFFHNFIADIEYKKLLKIFFEKYIYILAIALFYASLSFLLRNYFLFVEISQIFLLCNVIVIGLFFLEDRFKVFRDFLRINTLVVSLYYIWVFFWIILWWKHTALSYYDIANICTLYILFGLFIHNLKRNTLSGEFYSYIVLFIFLHSVVIGKYSFDAVALVSYFLSFWFSSLFFLATSQISEYFSVKKSYVRVWGLLFAFLSIFLSVSYSFFESFASMGVFIWSGLISWFLYSFHTRFENYVALGFSFLASSLSFHYFYHFLSWETYKSYVGIFFIVLSFCYLLFENYQTRRYAWQSYFIHTYSLGVNILWVILFFIFSNLSVLSISTLLMGESIYLFWSYFSFQKSKKWFTASIK